ncbi:MAG: hypothetical protein ABIL25_04710 [candidate division WOR-3 bacterium]
MRRLVVTLEPMHAAVPGGGELTGPIEIQGPWEAVTAGNVIEENLKGVGKRFLGIEFAPNWPAGSVVGGEDEGCGWAVGAKPGMGTAVNEDQLAEAGAAFPATAARPRRSG